MLKVCVILLVSLSMARVSSESVAGILYPRESETRDVTSLNGIWNFRIATTNQTSLGFEKEWFKTDLRQVNIT